MHIRVDQCSATARLLSFLASAERLAHDCAEGQSKLVEDAAARRFLRAQVRQEQHHTIVFEAGVLWLSPRGVPASSPDNALAGFRTHLERALERGEVAETFLAEQVVLEGLAEIALTRVDAGIADRGGGFEHVRQLILKQERAHHGFGVAQLNALINARPELVDRLRHVLPMYIELARAMLQALAELFDAFDEDPNEYLNLALAALPAPLRIESG